MKLWSEDITADQPIPRRHTCDGEDISPHLAWSGVPAEAVSLALVCHDPDAPVGDWTHWLICDLPPRDGEIARGEALPQGAVEIANHFGFSHYGGPCPPSGTHRYFFKLFALAEPGPRGLTRSDFQAMVEKKAIAGAEFMATYSRAR